MPAMCWAILILLLAGTASVLLERRKNLSRFASPEMDVNRDVKRETQFLGQYGQFTCLVIACALILTLDGPTAWPAAAALVLGAVLNLLSTHAAKRVFGRIRPGRERDGYYRGAFLGPTWRRLSWRESFPSSHAAGAFAMSAALYELYPDGALVWWGLATITSVIRWLIDAHFLSDVLVGSAMGIACGMAAVWLVGAG
jgi:membrane-associated phospholipid phosphatase